MPCSPHFHHSLSLEALRKSARDAAARVSEQLRCEVHCEYLGVESGTKSKKVYVADPMKWEGRKIQCEVTYAWSVGGGDDMMRVTSTMRADNALSREVVPPPSIERRAFQQKIQKQLEKARLRANASFSKGQLTTAVFSELFCPRRGRRHRSSPFGLSEMVWHAKRLVALRRRRRNGGA